MADFQNSKLATGLGFLFLGVLSVGLFMPLMLPALIPLLGLVGSAFFYRSENRLPKIDYSLLCVILMLSGLLIASSLWSIAPYVSLNRAFKVSALFILCCPFLFLCHELPQRSLNILRKWCVFPLLLGAIILYIELKYSYPIFRFIKNFPDDAYISPAALNKHIAALVLLTPFGLIYAFQKKFLILSILLVIVLGMILSITEDNAAQLAAIVMVISVPLLAIMPNAIPILAFTCLAFVLLFMPFLSHIAFDEFAELLSQSGSLAKQANMSMRLENWDFISRRIMESPLVGFGIDSTRAMTFDTEQKYFHGSTILHPHNIILQIWIEFGVIGVIGALGLLFFLYRRFVSLPLASRLLPFSLLGGLMIFLLVSWSCWAGWLDALILLISGLLILEMKSRVGTSISKPQHCADNSK